MLLTLLIALPALCALPLVLSKEPDGRELKVWSLMAALLTFVVSLPLWGYAPDGALFQFVETHSWIDIKGLKIGFNLGVDGPAALLVLLTTFIVPIAMLGSWNYITKRQKEFYIAVLLLESAMIGVFCATDMFLFYAFFEATLLPMYLIIGVWGGDDKIYATTKFVLYTAFGSLLMFVAILYIYNKTGSSSFAFSEIQDKLKLIRSLPETDPRHFSRNAEFWCFWAFALAFSIKVPLFPVHTWLPDAHVQAPTPGSVILAAVLLKMGGYGFYRMALPFFPRAVEVYTPLLMTICVIGIIYGSMMAFAQRDIKKLIAYSSVAHMGTCMLGIFSQYSIGVQGGLYQMINHGISTGALFLMIGMLYERTHSRALDYYGGIAKVIPVYTTFFVIVTMSSIGLPLTNGFVGEFFCMIGAFYRSPILGAFAGTGVVLGAVYMLYLVKRVFFGRLTRESNKSLADLNGREVAVLLPLILMIFVLGLFPKPFTDRMAPSVKAFIAAMPERKVADVAVPPPLAPSAPAHHHDEKKVEPPPAPPVAPVVPAAPAPTATKKVN